MYIVKILVTTLAVLAFVPQSFAQVADDYETAIVGNYCPSISITMKRGARDSSASGQVTELQKFLSGYYDIDPQELVTGFFGRITQDYVLRFQKEQGLPTFGIVGSMTRTIIAKKCSEITSEGQSINTNQSTRSGIFTTSSSLFPDMNTVTSSSATATYSYINASAGTGGTISPSGSVVMSSTGTQTFTATPNSGYAISSFVVDGVNKGAISSYTFSNVTSNHTISVSFSKTATRTISVVVSSGGSVSPSESVSVVNGGSQSFVATANAGYKALVQVDGVTIYENVPYNTGTGTFLIPAGSSTGTFSNVTGNHTIRVSFSAN